MKQIIVSIVALFAVSISGFSQQTYHLKSSDNSYQKIEFKADKGTNVPVNEMEVKIQWNPGEAYFTMHFKNEKGLNKDKYIYFFPKMEKMSKIKKDNIKLWFDKKLKKESTKVVFAYYNNDDNNSKGENIQIFDLGKEDSFELRFTIKPNETNTFNFKLYVYIAENLFKGKRDKKISSLDMIDFEIELINPCADGLIAEKIKQFSNEQKEIETLLENLDTETKKLSSSNTCFKSEKLIINKEKINDDFVVCDAYNSAITELNREIEEYNKKVGGYNKTLKDLQKGCKKCDCDCKALEDGLQEKLGPLFTSVSQNKIDKKAAQQELDTIKKSSIKCVGNCTGKNRNTICSSQCKEAYKKFQDYCAKIEKLLK